MDGERFDFLARVLGAGANRREALGALLAGALTALCGRGESGAQSIEAERHRRHRRSHKCSLHCPQGFRCSHRREDSRKKRRRPLCCSARPGRECCPPAENENCGGDCCPRGQCAGGLCCPRYLFETCASRCCSTPEETCVNGECVCHTVICNGLCCNEFFAGGSCLRDPRDGQPTCCMAAAACGELCCYEYLGPVACCNGGCCAEGESCVDGRCGCGGGPSCPAGQTCLAGSCCPDDRFCPKGFTSDTSRNAVCCPEGTACTGRCSAAGQECQTQCCPLERVCGEDGADCCVEGAHCVQGQCVFDRA